MKKNRVALLGLLALFSMQINTYAQGLDIYVYLANKDSVLNRPKDAKVQEQKEREFDLISKTIRSSEFVYIGKKMYTPSQSFVRNFDGYKSLYPFAGMLSENPPPPGNFHDDKEYILEWEIIDNTLYLIELRIGGFDSTYLKDTSNLNNLTLKEHYAIFKVFETFEKFTGGTFLKPNDKLYKKPQNGYYGKEQIMKADWVNGTYLLREWGVIDRQSYIEYPYSVQAVEFKNGVVVSMKEIDSLRYD